MSAWTVTRAHIDALVLAGVQFGIIRDPSPQNLAELGTDLWRENHRSVNHRYGHSNVVPDYPAPTAEMVLDPVAVVKVIDCYAYQSCEHPGWVRSAARAYCHRLRTAVMADLPVDIFDEQPYPVGWDAAPWGITSLDQAAIGSAAAASYSADDPQRRR